MRSKTREKSRRFETAHGWFSVRANGFVGDNSRVTFIIAVGHALAMIGRLREAVEGGYR